MDIIITTFLGSAHEATPSIRCCGAQQYCVSLGTNNSQLGGVFFRTQRCQQFPPQVTASGISLEGGGVIRSATANVVTVNPGGDHMLILKHCVQNSKAATASVTCALTINGDHLDAHSYAIKADPTKPMLNVTTPIRLFWVPGSSPARSTHFLDNRYLPAITSPQRCCWFLQ